MGHHLFVTHSYLQYSNINRRNTMKALINLISVALALGSVHASAVSMEQAQAIVGKLKNGAQATEIRKFSREGKTIYEIEYVYEGEEYEAIVTPSGEVLETYKDTGGTGMPIILALAASQESQLYKDQSQSAEIIPIVIGNYGRFWFKGLRHGYSLYQTQSFQFSPMIKINPDSGYQKSEVENNSLLYNNLEDTDITVEAGAQFHMDFNLLEMDLNLLTDITGGHKGNLLELAFSKPKRINNLLFIPSLTFTYNDKKVTNYYFGVNENLAAPYRPAFDTGSSLDTEISTMVIWNFNHRWYLIGDLTYKFYDDNLENSPLVDSANQASGFIGVGYSF